MQLKNILLFVLTSILISSCGLLLNASQGDFTIKEAYYQSWILNENEKGTDVYLVLKNVKPSVEFRTIIFRGMELPIHRMIKNDAIILKASFTIGLTKLAQEKKISAEENQLIYKIGKLEKTQILRKIRRKKTRYY